MFVLQVLFLCSGDLRNALFTISKFTEAYPKLNLHLCDKSEVITARNVFLSYLMFSDGFDSKKTSDVDYLWDVWYSTRWSETVRERFIKDLKQLIASRWSNKSDVVVPELVAAKHLEKTFECWMNYATSMSAKTISKILKQR